VYAGQHSGHGFGLRVQGLGLGSAGSDLELFDAALQPSLLALPGSELLLEHFDDISPQLLLKLA